MEYVTLGKTALIVSRTAFSVPSVDSTDTMEALSALLQKAYEAGINLFHVCAKNEMSLKTLGYTFAKHRDEVRFIVETTQHKGSELSSFIEKCLSSMETDYIDVLELNIDASLLYSSAFDELNAVLQDAKNRSLIKHFALKVKNADEGKAAIMSGRCEIIDYQYSFPSQKEEDQLIELCEATETGFFASNPGGNEDAIDSKLYAFLAKKENVIPLWNLKSEEKLESILHLAQQS